MSLLQIPEHHHFSTPCPRREAPEPIYETISNVAGVIVSRAAPTQAEIDGAAKGLAIIGQNSLGRYLSSLSNDRRDPNALLTHVERIVALRDVLPLTDRAY